jgi:VWFA-related protein
MLWWTQCGGWWIGFAMGLRFCTALAISCAFGQEQGFRIETRVVQVPVTVTDSRGRGVDGLRARDFHVFDDGTKREITLDTFGTGLAPISLVIAIQSSGVSSSALTRIRRIGGMIQPLVIGRRGEAAVAAFDADIKWLHDFTADSDALQSTVGNLTTGAALQARMFDAVIESADRMKERKGRRILLVISEIRDRGSHAHLEEALQAVEREGVEVFAASYSAYATSMSANAGELPPPSGPNYLAVFNELARLGKTNDIQALTQATGGSDYPFMRERAVEKAVEKLGVDVHSQYILSFRQGAVKPGMHRIDVATPERTDLRIRSRRAYWAE